MDCGLTEQFDAERTSRGFLEAVKLEMYSDQVFCFTPKGEVVKLPRGATPIDFAYAIHTRIGSALRRGQGRWIARAVVDATSKTGSRSKSSPPKARYPSGDMAGDRHRRARPSRPSGAPSAPGGSGSGSSSWGASWPAPPSRHVAVKRPPTRRWTAAAQCCVLAGRMSANHCWPVWAVRN